MFNTECWLFLCSWSAGMAEELRLFLAAHPTASYTGVKGMLMRCLIRPQNITLMRYDGNIMKAIEAPKTFWGLLPCQQHLHVDTSLCVVLCESYDEGGVHVNPHFEGELFVRVACQVIFMWVFCVRSLCFALVLFSCFLFHEAHFKQANHMTELVPLLATMGYIHFEYLFMYHYVCSK